MESTTGGCGTSWSRNVYWVSMFYQLLIFTLVIKITGPKLYNPYFCYISLETKLDSSENLKLLCEVQNVDLVLYSF